MVLMKSFLLSLSVFCLFASVAFFVYQKASQSETSAQISPPIQPQKPAYAATEDSIVFSPDGTRKLIMKQKQKGGTITYTFFIENGSETEKLLFSKSVSSKETFVIPPNTWSPDNTYVFINEYYKGKTTVYVVDTTQSIIAENDLVNITDIFKNRNSLYSFVESTGWAAPQLLIVETKNGTQLGPSFWYDTTSKGFIQLARRQ